MLAPVVAAVRLPGPRAPPPGPGGSLVLVACSGGAASLALAAATAFVAPRRNLRCGLVSVDHGLQPGSRDRAGAVAAWAKEEGFDPASAVSVEVGRDGGPEAAARTARYAALAGTARRDGAVAVLLGHTRDDQAETVLLAMARGAGPRGLAGMPARRDLDGVALLRPLLDLGRSDTLAACAALGLEPWQDPHNTDAAYTRSRVRAVLPILVEALGPGLVGNLARTARQAAADAEVLDRLPAPGGRPPHPAVLAALPAAVRTRVLHRWARDLGAGGSALSARHID